ncbi:putative allantoin permease [Xylogone sp. PMI_703]|nr:putative allantoin permease [Xylogone sp. PMI_703]
MGISELTMRAKHAVTTKEGFLEMIRTKETEKMAQNRANGEQLLSNVDLDPSPPEARKWGFWYFLLFEFSVAFSPTSYNVGAALISIGLPYWAIITSAFIASALCAAVIYLNARVGAVYHIGFPVSIRISAGIRGSMFFIAIRAVVAILYMATQSLYASFLTSVCLRCIFGHYWTDIKNTLPANAGITTSGLAAFVIFWCIQLPFAFIHPSKSAPVFAAKSIVVPPCLLVTMIWCLVKAGGPHWDKFEKAQIHGSAAAWAWLLAINSVVSGTLPPLINIPDLSRYAKKPSDVNPLALGLFLSKPIIIIIGILTTAAGNQLYGTAYWNIWDLYQSILTDNWHSSTRFLVFIGALTQIYATMVTNISSNSIPVGCDLAGLFPRYFTIRRGQILCSILAFAIAPWKIVYSAASFLTFLGSYVCFITPIAVTMIIDYWIVRRGNVHVPSLYRPNPSSPYWYIMGFNPRAYAAWAIGVGLTIAGIAGKLSPGSVPTGVVNIYNTSFILSAASSGLFYYLFTRIWPLPVYPAEHEHESRTWEYMRPSDGYFDEDEESHTITPGIEIGDGASSSTVQPVVSATEKDIEKY